MVLNTHSPSCKCLEEMKKRYGYNWAHCKTGQPFLHAEVHLTINTLWETLYSLLQILTLRQLAVALDWL